MGMLPGPCFHIIVVLLTAVLWEVSVVRGQGGKPEIYSLHITSGIQFRFATTLVTSLIANPLNKSTEAAFKVTLPKEAFISNFTMEIDGVVYPGNVKGKEQAKREFNAAKKKGQSAGHVSQSPRDTRVFKVEVNVAARSKVYFNLTYQEVLQRRKGIYQHKIYVHPGQPVRDLRIRVAIQESRKITTLNVPPIQTDVLTNDYNKPNAIAVVTRPDPKSAHVSFVPTLSQQTEKSTNGLAGQFIVEYDVDRSLDAGDVLVVNGYFVHFIAPELGTDISKDVIFILDKSGSMSGHKFVQLKEAMYEILSDLQPDDRFTIAVFSSGVNFLYNNFVPATPEFVADAKGKVNNLHATGGTNINKALLDGIKKFLNQADPDAEERVPVILFLTDGQASAGVIYYEDILKNVKKANSKSGLNIPINTLAFGSGADYSLVQKIALQNNGVARKIYEESDSALQITGFYAEVSNTMLRDVKIQYLGDTVDVDSLTKPGTFFSGSELIVAGKLKGDATALSLNVLGTGAEGNVKLALDPDDNLDVSEVSGLITGEDFAKITEKMWAYLTIKEYLKKIDSGDYKGGAVAKLKQKVLDLSIKNSFVTRLTSMVVTKPEETPSAEELSEGGAPPARSQGRTLSARRPPPTKSPVRQNLARLPPPTKSPVRQNVARLPPPTKSPVRQNLASGPPPTKSPVRQNLASGPPPTKSPVRQNLASGPPPTKSPVRQNLASVPPPTKSPVRQNVARLPPPKSYPRRQYSGGGGGYGGGGGGDPHYMVRLYGLDHPVCFDFDSEKEEFYKLIHDPAHEIFINVATVLSERRQKDGDPKTFLGEVGIETKHHIIVVTPDAIIFDKKILTWEYGQVHHLGNSNFSVVELQDGTATMSVRFEFGATLYIQRHMRQDRGLINYLNVYVSGEDSFSKRSEGLIGQFVNGHKHVVMKKQFASASDQAVAKFQVKEGPTFHASADGSKGKKTRHVVRAKLIYRGEVVDDGEEKCWMVHQPFLDLLIGSHDDYLIPGLLPHLETRKNRQE